MIILMKPVTIMMFMICKCVFIDVIMFRCVLQSFHQQDSATISLVLEPSWVFLEAVSFYSMDFSLMTTKEAFSAPKNFSRVLNTPNLASSDSVMGSPWMARL